MPTSLARWSAAVLFGALLLGSPVALTAQEPRPHDGPPHPEHRPHPDQRPPQDHMVDRLAEVLERLDRIADRLGQPQGPGPHAPNQPGPHGPWQAPGVAEPTPPPQPGPMVMPTPHGPQQLPQPLVEILQGRDRQLAEMREMFEIRSREMAESHERQLTEMREAFDARSREMMAAREQGQQMLAEMGKQVSETREHVAKTLQGMGAFKERIEETRQAMASFKERAEDGGRRFAEMQDRLELLEREIDRLHAELRERDDDDDEGDD